MIFSLQSRCTGCRVPFSDPRCFLPVTVYGTTHAHLVHMCWPLLWGLHQMGRCFATFGTYALVGSLQWIMSLLNSRLEAVVGGSPSLQSRRTLPPCLRNAKCRHSPHSPLHLCSVCLHRWRVPQFALEYPCNPPPPSKGGDCHLVTVPPTRGGDCRALFGEISEGGEGISYALVQATVGAGTVLIWDRILIRYQT